jgi:cell division protein FtsI/penicillin-binding protein 2
MNEPFPQHRLRIVSIAVTVIVGVIVYRLIDIQIIDHEAYRAAAEGQWYDTLRIPARRGNIFDRNGFPLAVTHWNYTVGVTPRDFPARDNKAVERLADACAMSKKELRRRLKKDDAYVPLGRDLHLTEDQVSQLSSLAGVRLDPNHDRLYPFDSMPPQLLGAINLDGKGTAGVELAFDELLAGRDGSLLVCRLPGNRKGFRPADAPGEKPRNGSDLYLTIDTRVQAIVDFELAQAVDRYGAAGGMAIIVEPSTGDILAISEKPLRPISAETSRPELFALRSINCIYEPGSTFKLVTDSYLLERGKVDPYDAFFGENGAARFDFGVIHDDHEHGWLTFKESFVYSSNICTIKAVLGSDPSDFYRYLLRFGFGGRTGIDLPAESRGTLREPRPHVWSARSLASMAIGHEIGVTPVQMVMAYSALANGGTLVVPRIALEAREPRGGMAATFQPIAIRRVFSDRTSATMQDFCAEVVSDGTGKKAAVDGISVAGKTGTAQKAIDGRYEKGKYIASFIGYAPADHPRIVCFVALDEPAYPYWWGGESAAIVFSKIVEGVNLSTDLLYDGSSVSIASERANRGGKRVPSFLRLTASEAIDLGAEWGVRVSCPGGPGIVYSQAPDPGTLISRNEEVSLLVRGADEKWHGVRSVPDLHALSIREARRILLGCGFECSIHGFGIVDRQDPPPRTLMKPGGSVVLYCSPRSASLNQAVMQIAEGARH